jgi:hypothetical protein
MRDAHSYCFYLCHVTVDWTPPLAYTNGCYISYKFLQCLCRDIPSSFVGTLTRKQCSGYHGLLIAFGVAAWREGQSVRAVARHTWAERQNGFCSLFAAVELRCRSSNGAAA